MIRPSLGARDVSGIVDRVLEAGEGLVGRRRAEAEATQAGRRAAAAVRTERRQTAGDSDGDDSDSDTETECRRAGHVVVVVVGQQLVLGASLQLRLR